MKTALEDRLHWGILGSAKIAQRAIIPEILKSYNSNLVGIASRSPIKAVEMAHKYSCKPYNYEDLINDTSINSIYIPLPNSMHFEWIKKALEANKNVLVEKSAVMNLIQAQEICQISSNRDLMLMENFQFQFHSQHAYVKDIIHQGKIGEIRSFRSSFGFPPFDEQSNIRYKKELGGGSLFDAGAYTLKACSFISELDLEVVAAHLTYHKKYGVDWFGSGMLKSRNGEFTGLVAFGFDNYYQCNYEIWGSEGFLSSTRAFTAKPEYNPEIIISTKSGGSEKLILPQDNHFKNMLYYFEQAVQNNDITKRHSERHKILKQSSLLSSFLSSAK